MTCTEPGCGRLSLNATGLCAIHAHPSAYQPTPAELKAQEAEWRLLREVESEENVRIQWERTFAAADADPTKGRLSWPRPSWFYQ